MRNLVYTGSLNIVKITFGYILENVGKDHRDRLGLRGTYDGLISHETCIKQEAWFVLNRRFGNQKL